MKIEVDKEDLIEILKDVNSRANTCEAFRRLDAATRRPKIHIVGRRWFSSTEGNTYHSVRIYVNDEMVNYTRLAYGYGDQYLQTAINWLHANGYIEGEKQHGTLFLRETLGATYEVHDVERKKDL